VAQLGAGEQGARPVRAGGHAGTAANAGGEVSALDRVIEAGAFVSVDAGTAPDADTVQIPQHVAEAALGRVSALVGTEPGRQAGIVIRPTVCHA
jgi:hypothetical protein